jgi:hypothetical protein
VTLSATRSVTAWPRAPTAAAATADVWARDAADEGVARLGGGGGSGGGSRCRRAPAAAGGSERTTKRAQRSWTSAFSMTTPASGAAAAAAAAAAGSDDVGRVRSESFRAHKEERKVWWLTILAVHMRDP